MKKLKTAKMTILVAVFALIFVPVFAGAQTQQQTGGAGAAGA
jgi:hypothetical protein